MKSALKIFTKLTPLATLAFLLVSLPPIQAQTNRDRGIGVRTWPNSAKRFALIIGVDKYKDEQVNPLKGASNDARTLSNALINYAGFPQNQVYLLTTDQPEDRQPTRAIILDRLVKLNGRITPDSLLLVFFAGHGMERNKEVYLLPSDVQDSATEDTALTASKIKEKVLKTGARQIILILDACRNDPMAGRANAGNSLTTSFVKGFDFDSQNREVEAYVTLYSTSPGHRAYEYMQKQQGFFTWALVEGLKGAAADQKGTITLAQLLRYVEDTVPKLVRQELGAAKEQKPWHVIEGFRAEELVISYLPTTGVSGPSERDLAELQNWQKIKASKNPEDFNRHLALYPEGNFAGQARSQLQTLSSKPVPVPTSPPSSAPSANAALGTHENPLLIGKRNINSNQPTPYTYDKEVGLGRHYAAKIDRSARLVEDRPIAEYVNRVAQNIALHSDAKVPFTIKVIDSDQIGALPLPGGFLYANKAMLLAADNEAEFAGLFAVMVAHIAARQGIEKAGHPDKLDSLPTTKDADWGNVSIPQAFVTFSPTELEESEKLAVQYLWDAGYDPHALGGYYRKLIRYGNQTPDSMSRIIGSQALLGERIDALNGLIARFPPRGEYTINTAEFQKAKNRLISLTNPNAANPQTIAEADSKRPALRRQESEPSTPQTNPAAGQGRSVTPDNTQQRNDASRQIVKDHFFTFELQKCEKSGSVVICSVHITNNSDDRELFLGDNGTRLFDDSGNGYNAIEVKIAGDTSTLPRTIRGGSSSSLLVSGVPTLARIAFTNVAANSTKASLLELYCIYRQDDFKIKFRNVPFQ